MNKFRMHAANTLNALYIIMFVLILRAAFIGMYRQLPIAALCVLAALVLLLILLWRGHTQTDTVLGRVHVFAHILSFLLSMYVIYSCRVQFSWDWGDVVRNAKSLALEDKLLNNNYFLQYPNNQFWLAVMSLYFRMLKLLLPSVREGALEIAAMGLSLFFVRSGGVLVYHNLAMCFGRRRACIADTVFTLYLPLHLYVYFAYTDTSGFFTVSFLVFLFLKLRSQGRSSLVLLLALALTAALLFEIKLMAFLVIPAILLTEFLDAPDGFFRRLIPLCAVSLVLILLFSQTAKAIIHLDTSQKDRYAFPPSHWLMIGMNEYGGYWHGDVEFSQSFETLAERRAATLHEWHRRMATRGPVGTLRFMVNDKLCRTWGNSLLGGDDYISRKPVAPASLGEAFFAQEGAYHNVVLLYSWPYHFLLLLGCLLSGLMSKDKAPLRFARLSLMAITVFLAFWECNSRYLFTYIPALFLCCADGYFALRDRIRSSKQNLILKG